VSVDFFGGLDYDKIAQKVAAKLLTTPLLQLSDGTLIANPRLFKKIIEGKAFSVSHRFEDVAADAYEDFFFENPQNSGKTVTIIMVEITALTQCFVDVYRGNSVTSNGTELTPINLNFSSSNTSVVNVEYGGTYTLGDRTISLVVPGGSKQFAVGGAVEVGEAAVIPENFNFLVRVTNKSTSASSFSVRVIWWEE